MASSPNTVPGPIEIMNLPSRETSTLPSAKDKNFNILISITFRNIKKKHVRRDSNEHRSNWTVEPVDIWDVAATIPSSADATPHCGCRRLVCGIAQRLGISRKTSDAEWSTSDASFNRLVQLAEKMLKAGRNTRDRSRFSHRPARTDRFRQLRPETGVRQRKKRKTRRRKEIENETLLINEDI